MRAFLGFLFGALIALVFVWALLEIVNRDHASKEVRFSPAQCSTIPTGREHVTAFEVRDHAGTGVGVTQTPTAHEWVTVCEKSEWR